MDDFTGPPQMPRPNVLNPGENPNPPIALEHDPETDRWTLLVDDGMARRGLVLSDSIVDALAARIAAQSPQEPTADGWYAYSGGAQAIIFRLTRGQWFVVTDSGQMNPCAWGYIEQALSVWDLVPMLPSP